MKIMYAYTQLFINGIKLFQLIFTRDVKHVRKQKQWHKSCNIISLQDSYPLTLRKKLKNLFQSYSLNEIIRIATLHIASFPT